MRVEWSTEGGVSACMSARVHLEAGDNLRFPSSSTIHLIFEMSSLTGLEHVKLGGQSVSSKEPHATLHQLPSTELTSTGQLTHQLLYMGSEEQSHALILVRRAISSLSFSLKLES